VPALTLRGRYVMREFWSDSDLFLRLNAAERELYIGLWMLADDGGWLPRDVPGIGAALYRFEDRKPREKRVTDGLDKLRRLGKVESHRCCLFVPSVVRYPRPGRKSAEHTQEHERHIKRPSKRNNPVQSGSTLPVPTPTQPDPKERFEHRDDEEPARPIPGASAGEAAWAELGVKLGRTRGA